MTEKVREIGSYEARVRWSQLLDEVGEGASYLISKRREPVAVLVPLERGLGAENADEQELAQLLELFEAQHTNTLARLDKAFAELATTRAALDEWCAERQELSRDNHQESSSGGSA